VPKPPFVERLVEPGIDTRAVKVCFVRIVLVRDLRSEGRLSQISIEDRGSALG
jgi:hypothetical protein